MTGPLERYAAFLRGMNLGGRRIKNEDLRAEFEALGFEAVRTFRASGNVIFSASGGAGEAALRKRIEAGLGDALGYEVPVFLRGREELAAIVAREPFAPELLAASKGKLQVSFLARKPGAKARRAVEDASSPADRLALGVRELYWLPSGGVSESELDWRPLDAGLGLATMRTIGTVEQIAARLAS